MSRVTVIGYDGPAGGHYVINAPLPVEARNVLHTWMPYTSRIKVRDERGTEFFVNFFRKKGRKA